MKSVIFVASLLCYFNVRLEAEGNIEWPHCTLGACFSWYAILGSYRTVGHTTSVASISQNLPPPFYSWYWHSVVSVRTRPQAMHLKIMIWFLVGAWDFFILQCLHWLQSPSTLLYSGYLRLFDSFTWNIELGHESDHCPPYNTIV